MKDSLIVLGEGCLASKIKASLRPRRTRDEICKLQSWLPRGLWHETVFSGDGPLVFGQFELAKMLAHQWVTTLRALENQGNGGARQ